MANEKRLILEPCPFCGGNAEIMGSAFYWVRCESCGVETKGFHHKWQAVDAWNRRTHDEIDYDYEAED